MFEQITQLFRLLTVDERRTLLRLQVLVLLMSFAEVFGVLSIGPFMALVGNIDQLQGDGLLADIYRQAGIAEPRHFLIIIGALVLVILGLGTAISIYTTWQFAMYGNRVGAKLSI